MQTRWMGHEYKITMRNVLKETRKDSSSVKQKQGYILKEGGRNNRYEEQNS